MEYSIAYSNDYEHSYLLGPPEANSEGNLELGIAAGIEFNLGGVGLELGISGGLAWNTKRSHSGTKSEGSSTQITVVLGDADGDDYFVVDVLTDPKYGTFVFHTVAGSSSCPHEEGTDYSAKANIVLAKKPEGHVLPDQSMAFQLQLTNQGIAEGDFEVRSIWGA